MIERIDMTGLGICSPQSCIMVPIAKLREYHAEMDRLEAEIDRLVAQAAADPAPVVSVLWEIAQERTRQDEKWGVQNHHPLVWLAILGEEVGEATKNLLGARFCAGAGERTGQYQAARTELIQAAAVAVAMVEALDRNELQEMPA